MKVRWSWEEIAELLSETIPLLVRGILPLGAATWLFLTVLGDAPKELHGGSQSYFRETTMLLAIFIIMTAFMGERIFIRSDRFRIGPRPKKTVSQEKTATDQYSELVKASRTLAGSLYDRSGVYLIAGVLLAVGGIGMFYLIRPAIDGRMSVIGLVVALLPGSSMLLLVELIAFFFLRQSRSIMDEFRHFDHIARYREEVLAALRLAASAGKPLDISDLMSNGFYFTRSERLTAGESTEIVEARKLEKTEIDLLNKVVELIAVKAKP